MGFGFQISFRNIRKKSLYEAVEYLISIFLKSTGQNGYVQYFLDIVLERDVRNMAGVGDFLEFWERNAGKFSVASPDDADAVRIMTIHKAKGLEFPIVIFPFAEEEFGRKPKDKLWLNADEQVFGLPKVLIDNNSNVEHFGEDANAIFSQKKQEEILDNINVLYVALTRAEEQLYIISALNLGKNDVKPKNNLCTYFISYIETLGPFDKDRLEYEFGLPEKVSKARFTAEPIKDIPSVTRKLDPSAIRISKKESLMWGTHQQESIEYGNVIHEILSRIKFRDDAGSAISEALETGLISEDQKLLVTETINRILSHEELKVFFSGGIVLNEQVIIQKQGRILKPDRMVITGKDIVLLDYKTGTHDPKYIRQLDTYQEAIEKAGYRVTKKALVYIGDNVNVVNL